jgi:inosine/xanthosine triphosphate pyrophosphatase family protein
LAQLDMELKNTISHRSEAFGKAVKILADVLNK